MTTFQDVCSQLMKPAKELAEWDFPLAQILEDYYTLLSEPCDLNFSEAALVLQNSANVFVRRVEYLYQETVALSKSMKEHEDNEEDGQKKNKNHRKSRKAVIDFKNFNLIDFNNGILKKSHEREKPTKEERKIKLISPRFPQLENISRHKFSQDIIDVQGEIIGKKYDFRCNQQLTVSKMLIGEVIPLDFNDKELNDSDSSINNTELVHCDDNFGLCSDVDDNNDDEEISRDAGITSPTLESAYGSMVSSSNPNTPSCRIISDFSQSLNHTLKDTDGPLMSPIADSSIESDGCPNDSGMEQSTTPVSENIESDGAELCEQNSEVDSEIHSEKHSENDTEQNSEKSSDKTECENLLNDTTSSMTTENTSKNRDSIEADAGYTSGDPDDLQTNSTPKKLKTPDELIENSWKPIPVESVVPDKIPRCRREFKLPCHIALLTTVPKLRKRTLNDTAKKRYSKKSSLEKEAENAAKEAGEIKKIFEERLKVQSELDNQNYEAVMSESMHLVGYQSRVSHAETASNQDLNNSKDLLEDKSRHPSLSEAACSPPPSPDNFSDHAQDDEPFENSDLSGFQTVGQSHQERIEQKMLELKKKFDVTHEREKASTKWYEAVEALKAAENRPSFHVNEYEKRIIDSLKAKNEHQVEFHEIAEQEEPGNIARLFVASLHLANTYNVELNVVNKEDNSELNLKLLDAEYSHET